MRTVPLSVIMQQAVILSYRRFGTTYRSCQLRVLLFFIFVFSHLLGFLCFCLSHLEIFHSQNVFLQSSTDDCSSLSLLPLVSSLSAHSTLLIQRPHSSLCKPRTNWISDFLFGFLTLEDGTDRLSRNVLRNCHYTLRNNREERWNYDIKNPGFVLNFLLFGSFILPPGAAAPLALSILPTLPYRHTVQRIQNLSPRGLCDNTLLE
jgi:hypothetical protein